MSDAVLVALITVTSNIILQVVLSAKQSKDLLAQLKYESQKSDMALDAKLEKYMAVQNEKIDELSRRVEKHNQVVERTYELENKVGRQEEQIKTLFNNAHE